MVETLNHVTAQVMSGSRDGRREKPAAGIGCGKGAGGDGTSVKLSGDSVPTFGEYSDFIELCDLHLNECRQERNGDIVVRGTFKDASKDVDVKYISKSNIVHDEAVNATLGRHLFSNAPAGAQYHQEAVLLRKLQGSCHVARFHGSYSLTSAFPLHQYAAFLVSESTQGKSRLDEWVQQSAGACFGEPADLGCEWDVVDQSRFRERLHIAKQMLEVVLHMHRNDVSHRHLSLESFYVADAGSGEDASPQVKLHDVSTATRASETCALPILEPACPMSTTMSPEQLSPFMVANMTSLDCPTQKSDLWALGMLFSRLLYNTNVSSHLEEYLGRLIALRNAAEDPSLSKGEALAQHLSRQAWLRRFLYGSESDPLFPEAPADVSGKDAKFFEQFHLGQELCLSLLQLEQARPTAVEAMQSLQEVIECV